MIDPTAPEPGVPPSGGDAGAAPSGAAAPPSPSLLQLLRDVLEELPGLVSDRVQLVALELRRAGLAMAQIVALVVASGILLCTAWLATWVGLAYAAIEAGAPWGWVLLGVIAINLVAAAFMLLRARVLARLLTLPATVRRLSVGKPGVPVSSMQGPTIHGSEGQPLHS